MDFSNYIFRCHYQGDLVSVPKSLTQNQSETLEAFRERANGIGRPLTAKQTETWHDLEAKLAASNKYSLSTTAKKICTDIVMAERFGRTYRKANKYFVKGLEVEKQGRDLLSKVTGKLLVASNERRSNEWVNGAVDIEPEGIITDIKNSYSYNTFVQHLIDEKSEYYNRQLDSYMELWDVPMAQIAYVLIDTPFQLIERELRQADWDEDILTISGDVRDEKIQTVVDIVCQYLYTRKALEEFCELSSFVHIEWFDDFIEIPEESRVHIVQHEFNKERIQQRNESLIICREYMNSVKIINNINYGSNK